MIEQVALADSTNRITLAGLPKPPKAPTLPSDGVVDEAKPALNAEEEDDDDDDEDLKIVDQFKVKGKKKGDNWVGLEMVDRSVHSVSSTPTPTYLFGSLIRLYFVEQRDLVNHVVRTPHPQPSLINLIHHHDQNRQTPLRPQSRSIPRI